MLLKHNRLVIRNAIPTDAPQLEAWWNDGEIMAHAGLPYGSGERANDIAVRIAQDTDENRHLILELDSNPIGEASYGREDQETVGIGVKICNFSLHDQGLGKQYLSMLIRALFEDFGYKRVILDTNLANLRAQHVYERLGFKKVRVDTDSWTDQLGVLQSSVHYELTPEQFIDFVV